MRVVETDNFGGDYPNERFACPYYFNDKEARVVAECFNSLMSGCDAPRHWKVVDDDYELAPAFEP